MSWSIITRFAEQLGIPAEVWDLQLKTLLTLGFIHSPLINSVFVQCNMAIDKIKPDDSRVQKQSAEVNGRRWYYLDAAAKGRQKGVVFLIHGFPDQALGWRYQIPLLTDLGLRCIALQCMGYGDTGTSSDLRDFSFKTHADAVASISKQIGVDKIIVGGHDWGGAVVWRIAQWYPNLVSHVFSVCTPYFSVHDQYVSTESLVKRGVPQFGYQLQFGSPDHKVEKVVTDETKMWKFLAGFYGGRPKSGKKFFIPKEGIDLSLIEEDEIGMTPLLNQEEFDYYVKEFMKNGVNGPCNWYRTRQINFEDELNMAPEQRKGIKQPTLFIQATKDDVLTPDLAKGMEKSIANLSTREVPASHWALWHTPQETNDILKEWFEGVVLGGKSKL